MKKFNSFRSIAKENSGRFLGGFKNHATLNQRKEKNKNTIEIRLSKEALEKARLNIGDFVDIGITEDQQTLLIEAKKPDSDHYKITHGNNNKNGTGLIKLTWVEGMMDLLVEEDTVQIRTIDKESLFSFGRMELCLDLDNVGYIKRK